MTKHRLTPKTMKIIDVILRVLTLPFFLIMTFIFSIKLWVVWNVNFLKFGGESIAYTKKNQRATIQAIYNHLTKEDEQTQINIHKR